MYSENKIGGAVFWSVCAQIATKLISPIVNMALARILTPEAFGIVASITIITSFAEVFTDAGFQKYIVQHEFENEEDLDSSTNVAFWSNMVMAAAFVIVIIFFRKPLANLLGSPGIELGISVASINILFVTLSSTQTARYNRDLDFRTLFYIRIVTAFIPVIVTIPLALVVKNYWALLIGMMAGNLVNAILLTVKSKWKPKLFYSISILEEMLAFSIWILLDSVAIWLTAYIGSFIIGRYLDAYYLGLYKTSMTTVNGITNMITASIPPVMFTALSRWQNNTHEMNKTFWGFQRLSAIVLFPLGIGFFIFSDVVTWIFLGNQWGEATEFIGIWGLTSTFTLVFANYSSTYYRSKGKPKVSLMSQLLLLLVLVPTLLISVRYGFRTLYLARSLVSLYAILLALTIMKVVFHVSIIKTIKNVTPMIISAVAMGLVGHYLKMINNGMLWRLTSIFFCSVFYFSFIMLLFPQCRREILELSFVKKAVNAISHKR